MMPLRGGANFVAHVGQELRFRLIGAFRRLAGCPQLLLDLLSLGAVAIEFEGHVYGGDEGCSSGELDIADFGRPHRA